MMKVCIAEKPSVAKEIANVIGAGNRKDGYFEGNGYCVTWTFGHLCSLNEPHDYTEKWKWWNIHNLPMLPEKFDIKLIGNKGVEKQFNTIKYLVDRADEIINCGDAGQEGELIQRWVLKHAACNKPVKRLWISSLTEEAIRDGFTKLKEGALFDNLYYAGSSRAIGDWLLGMNATRLFTLKYGQNKQVLSIGRVQTPTLALIVNRHLEIENFSSHPFWELKTKYRDVVFNSDKGRFLDKKEAEKCLDEISEDVFVVSSVETKKGKEAAPRLFDLTSLQVECNKKFGYSADDTLKTVQVLYERKFVTYPRVDTTYLSNDIFPKIPGILKSLQNYQQFVEPLLTKTLKKSNKVFDDKKVTDHHAIIPTDITAHGLNTYEVKIYDLITRRFIAAFYPDCEVSNTTVIGKVKETDFKANGKQILDLGWRVVFQKEIISNEDDQDDSQVLPNFVKNESGPHEPGLLEKQTQPPKYYTEATLLRAMETAGKQVEDDELRELMKDNGIGRPSTRAAIIETLFKRNYIRKERKLLMPTLTGIGLIKTINNELLKSAELTGQWEYKLRQIEKGNYSYEAFLEEMKQMVSNLVLEVKNEKDKMIILENTNEGNSLKDKATSKSEVVKCPKCGKGKILKGKAAYGCSEYKEGCKFVVSFTQYGKILNEQQIFMLIRSQKTSHLKGFELDGKAREGLLQLNDNSEIVFVEQEPQEKAPKKEKKTEKIICPKCKTGEVLKGNTSYGCSNWRSGCGVRFPFVFLEVEISNHMLQQLLSKGKTKTIAGFVKEGKKVKSRLVLDNDFTVVLED